MRVRVSATNQQTISGFPMPKVSGVNIVNVTTNKPNETSISFLDVLNYATPTMRLQFNTTTDSFLVSAVYIKN